LIARRATDREFGEDRTPRRLAAPAIPKDVIKRYNAIVDVA
jgi:hypothetical protein